MTTRPPNPPDAHGADAHREAAHHDDAHRDAAARALLAMLPEPPTVAVARTRARLQRTFRGSTPRAPATSLVRVTVIAGSTGLGGALLAAVLLFAVWNPTPAPEAPVPVAASLASESGWAQAQLSGVSVSYLGAGEIGGTSAAPRMEWQRGVLNVEVTPGLGLDVRVATREAEVRVVGTGFTVTRDALGTRVDVRHGKVETRCGAPSSGGSADRTPSGDPTVLEAGDSATCLPLSAAGLLGRSRALAESGASPSEVLATVDVGLGVSEVGSPVHTELLAQRVEVLASLGRNAEALASCEALLSSGGGVRRDEILALAASLARQAGGCSTAAPWLIDAEVGGRALCAD